MPVLRPLPMVKIGIVGLKDDRETIVSVLHDMGVVQVESIGKETQEFLEPERVSELARSVGDEYLRFRGLKASLPARGTTRPRVFKDLNEVLATAKSVTVDKEVGDLKREEDELLSQTKALDDERELLERFQFYTDPLEYLQARPILAFLGEAESKPYEELLQAIPAISDLDILARREGDTVRFIVAVRREQADQVSRVALQKGVRLTAVPRRSGTISAVLPQIAAARGALQSRLNEIRGRLEAIAEEWNPTVAALEEALAIENRKLEIWTRLGATERTFALEGWVAKRDRRDLETGLSDATQDRLHLYEIPTTEEAPTVMWNPAGVSKYEFFIRFYSLPLSSEWDPTWVFAIAFPIFFGLMLGDIGYGAVILGFSLWMIAGFPGRRGIPGWLKDFIKLIMPPNAMRALAYTLVPASMIGIGLGFVFNTCFGFAFLPYQAPLDPIRNIGTLLLLSGYIGLFMVVLGFALGGLKEYFHHHYRGAVGKLGGVLFALGIAGIGLAMLTGRPYVPSSGSGLLLILEYVAALGGLVLLIVGEGAMGFMALIETVSHILSYTRIVGILLASVILAFVIDTIATQQFGQGAVGVLVGAVVLIFGQVFNLVLAVFEPGIQGARLIFVEHFSKFYSGNGRGFRPFGSSRRHTVSAYSERLGNLGVVGVRRR
jgi:V/A-type H+-transporting ATPase subunit I